MSFSSENEKPISEAIHALKAEGEASLVQALLDAIVDFNDAARFPKNVSKRVIVITGDADACDMGLDAVHAKLALLKKAGSQVDLDFHFIGVGLNDAGQSQISGLARETGGVADFAKDRQELQNLLSGAVNTPPSMPDPSSKPSELEAWLNARAVLDNLKSSEASLKRVIIDLNKRNYDGGYRDLELARGEIRKSQPDFENMRNRQPSDRYRRIYEAASTNRDIVSEMIPLLEAMLSQDKAKDYGAYQASIAKYESLRADYNSRLQDLEKQIEQLRPIQQ